MGQLSYTDVIALHYYFNGGKRDQQHCKSCKQWHYRHICSFGMTLRGPTYQWDLNEWDSEWGFLYMQWIGICGTIPEIILTNSTWSYTYKLQPLYVNGTHEAAKIVSHWLSPCCSWPILCIMWKQSWQLVRTLLSCMLADKHSWQSEHDDIMAWGREHCVNGRSWKHYITTTFRIYLVPGIAHNGWQ